MRGGVIFHSEMAPEGVAAALRREVGDERSAGSPAAGLRNESAVRGVVEGRNFRLRRRRHSNNHFAAEFYGRLEPEPGGTRVVGHFGFPRWVRTIMWAWLGAAAVIGIPVFLVSVAEISRGAQPVGASLWLGLLGPPALLLYALLLPMMGRYLRRSDERLLVNFLEKKLAASSGDSRLSMPEQK